MFAPAVSDKSSPFGLGCLRRASAARRLEARRRRRRASRLSPECPRAGSAFIPACYHWLRQHPMILPLLAFPTAEFAFRQIKARLRRASSLRAALARRRQPSPKGDDLSDTAGANMRALGKTVSARGRIVRTYTHCVRGTTRWPRERREDRGWGMSVLVVLSRNRPS